MKERVTSKNFRKILVALILCLGLFLVGGGIMTTVVRVSADTIADAAPAGTTNIAYGMAADDGRVTITKPQGTVGPPASNGALEHTYQVSPYSKVHLTDGNTQTNYSSLPFVYFSADDTASRSSVEIVFNFKGGCELYAVKLFEAAGAANNFPTTYTVSYSSDGSNYTQLATGTASDPRTDGGVYHALSSHVATQYVKFELAIPGTTYMQLGEIAIYGEYEYDPIKADAPAGTYNLAKNMAKDDSKVQITKLEIQPQFAHTTNAAKEHTYQMDGYAKVNLTDGNTTTTNYSSLPFAYGGTNAPIDIVFDFKAMRNLYAVKLFGAANAANNFPSTYTVSYSTDGETYTQLATGTKNSENAAYHAFATPTLARYVKFNLAIPSTTYMQLGEIAIYGNYDGVEGITLGANKYALNLPVGAEEKLEAQLEDNGDAIQDVKITNATFVSDNAAVATVGTDGTVKGIAAGTANITITSGANTVVVPVEVVEKKKGFDDNITFTIFYPPTKAFMGDDEDKWDEQYQLIANAGIDLVNNCNGGNWDLISKKDNMRMAKYSNKYGMRVSVADERMGPNFRNLTKEQIADLIGEYRNVAGVAGYYIQDEPYNPNIYTETYKYLKEADPNGYMHLNFLPYYAYPSVPEYEAQCNDWAAVNAATGYPQEFLMYDLYPYPDNDKQTMNREGFFINMESMRKVGLANNIKTANYLQSMRIAGSYRMPTVSEIRYEVMCGLAYGFKQFSYFTWFQVSAEHVQNEAFRDGIIGLDGKINHQDIYDGVTQINGVAHALGTTLIKLDSLQVYLNGNTWKQQSIPANFFVQPQDNKDYTVSYMRDKTTGKNYMMIVNNDFTNAQTVSIKLDSKIASLQRVSATDGTLSAVTMGANNTLSVQLAAGDGALYALPDSYDYENEKEQPVPKANLAADARIIANSSMGESYMFICNLNDGIRTSDNKQSNGWAAKQASGVELTVDFGKETEFNRIDLYPYGTHTVTYGAGLPQVFTVQISSDGKVWTNVKEYTESAPLTMQGVTPPSIVLDDAATARYARLIVEKATDGFVALAEIEIYNDDGNIPAPEYCLKTINKVITYKEGQNIALNKAIFASSAQGGANYRGWGVAIDFVNDGKEANVWSSSVGQNTSADSTEWVVVDFGDLFAVNKVRLYNFQTNGYFPIDYKVQLSINGRDFTDVETVTADDGSIGWREYEFAAQNARYVRVIGSKLRTRGNTDGYLMQISEIEAYGTPVVDKTENSTYAQASTFVQQATARLGNQIDEEAAPNLVKLVAVFNDNVLITQSGLDAVYVAAQIEYSEFGKNLKTTAAQALVAKIEALKDEDYHGKDTTSLKEKLTALKDLITAANEERCTQKSLDAAVKATQAELDSVLTFPITGLTALNSKISLTVGDVANVSAQLTPTYATDAVKYEVIDTDIVKVDKKGNIMAYAEGNTVVRITCGEFSTEVRVHVDPEAVEQDTPSGGCGGSVGTYGCALVSIALLGACMLMLRKKVTANK